ncbi:MAG: Fic family protein [Thermoleophilia bacterium]
MDPSQFHAPEAGRLVTVEGGHSAFVPAPLPPELTFDREFVVALSRADAALGELAGVGGDLPDPQLLDASFKRQEALCSSRIEGAQVTLSDLLLDQVGAARATAPRDHLREVRSCIGALRYGVERLQEVPLSLDLVRELHERLLRDDFGTDRSPGEFRATQTWIGPPGATLATATYVPPPVAEMHEALQAWDGFLRERGSLPDLVQVALIHEHFEAIHPFIGGNGRLGRLLVTLFLIERGRLPRPLLYLSAYLEVHRDQYYTLLQRTRTHGEWLPWLTFFVTGVRETAERATKQARALIADHALYRSQVKGHALQLAKELFRTPCITLPEAQRVLGGTSAAARRALRELGTKGLLVEYPGEHRPRVFLAQPILDAVLHPLEELRRLPGASEPGALLKSAPGQAAVPSSRAHRLMGEAVTLIDTARERGVDLRLIGGLAVRRHCVDLEFMDREYSDIDLVGVGHQSGELHEVLTEMGWVENRYITQSTDGGQLQYVSRERLGGDAPGAAPVGEEGREPPLVDHIDIFMDVMRMDHDVDVRGRLEIDDYAISPVDAFIAKMQIGKINEKDVHDVIALLKDVPLREVDDDESIFVPYLAEECAQDWGLHHDITTNIDVVLARLDDYGLSDVEVALVYGRLAAIREAIDDEEKSIRWWLRARVGKRVAWRREIEESEGSPVIAPEWDWRRDLG